MKEAKTVKIEPIKKGIVFSSFRLANNFLVNTYFPQLSNKHFTNESFEVFLIKSGLGFDLELVR